MRDAEPCWISTPAGTDTPLPAGCQAIVADGGEVRAPPPAVSELPVGLHTLIGRDGAALGWLAVTPRRPRSPARSWAWSVFPLTLRTGTSWGTGDCHDLRQFCTWSGGAGAGYVFLGPVNAGYVTPPLHPSPYSPRPGSSARSSCCTRRRSAAGGNSRRSTGRQPAGLRR